jgi:hypothetical protein
MTFSSQGREETPSLMATREEVINGVSTEVRWMVNQRMAKLRAEAHETMAVSPFLIPILFDLHHAEDFAELGELLLAGHLMIGHFTSFGKLIDERILPNVFGTTKLTGKFRAANPPFVEACFNEIDHLVPRPGSSPILLSLKASRWTIQLTMAMEMNTAFNTIITRYPDLYNEITVGVFYGTRQGLTDKYDILRGINRGKQHGVIDIQQHVNVVVGREFWAWLNEGEAATQDWVLDGILEGLNEANCREECRELLTAYASAFHRRYARHINSDRTINWHQILAELNG